MSDKYIEKFARLSSVRAAYMRDVTYPMHHEIQSLNPGAKVIGRAYTVAGPDIYLNALESIAPQSVYVHASGGSDAVWGGFYADFYGGKRGLLGAVIDGGIHGREITVDCKIPTFARFVCPRPAINRRTGLIQTPVVCGGAPVCPGDIIVADDDGVVVIPQCNQDEIYEKLDAFLAGMSFFKSLVQPDMVITEHEALGDLFEFKYAHPHDYWRCYEPWAAKWRGKYGQ